MSPVGLINRMPADLKKFDNFLRKSYTKYMSYAKDHDSIKAFIIWTYLGNVNRYSRGYARDPDTITQLPSEPDRGPPNIQTEIQSGEDSTVMSMIEDRGPTIVEASAVFDQVGAETLIAIKDILYGMEHGDYSIKSVISYSQDAENLHRALADQLYSLRLDINSGDRDFIRNPLPQEFEMRVKTEINTTGRTAGLINTSAKIIDVRSIEFLSAVIPNTNNFSEPAVYLGIQELPVDSYGSNAFLSRSFMLPFDDRYNLDQKIPELARRYIYCQPNVKVAVAKQATPITTMTFKFTDARGVAITLPKDVFTITGVAASNPVELTLDLGSYVDHNIDTGDHIHLSYAADKNNPLLKSYYIATRTANNKITIPIDNSGGGWTATFPERVVVEKYQFKLNIIISMPYPK